jgi:uncharacterized membrane protein
VLPLALYVLTARRGRYDVSGALRVVAVAALTAALVNLPFAVLGYRGWWASFAFQGLRKVDITTNSIWFWGFRPASNPSNESFQNVVDWLSPTLVFTSFAVALAVGWWRYRRDGVYPWICVSAAMLAGFLLLHKVHSPQYTLWLVPFFVLLRMPWSFVALYGAADIAMGIGIFRWFYVTKTGQPSGIYDSWESQAVMVGVWGRAVLLVVLFWLFLHARSTVEGASGAGGYIGSAHDPGIPRQATGDRAGREGRLAHAGDRGA